ncbi:uncharacterized protein LOC110425410 [Herrania umbratica]|uniref:Uncharacterized protein LOC110425410 n=1 Tax=Herrania umbratica TaxID=108875 RepID=A0A6J1B9K8_9ROSI|nr:uncharacterized protein LOC110425410 [Herrania umbratica]
MTMCLPKRPDCFAGALSLNPSSDMIRIKAINHSSHQQHDLHLVQSDFFYICNGCGASGSVPSQKPTCNACRKIVYGPNYYRCNHCNRNLHLSCARLPRTIAASNGMNMTLKNEYQPRCLYPMCPNTNSGWSYFSANEHYSYHAGCWKDQMLKNANPRAQRNGLLPLWNNVTRPHRLH